MEGKFTEQRGELAQVMERFVMKDGIHETLIPGLFFIRLSQISEPVHSVYQPSLCVIAQGSKIVMLGQESYQYDSDHYLTASVNLPISGQVVEASSNAPYFCLRLQFDMNQILDVIQASDLAESPNRKYGRGLAINRMNDSLHDAVMRLVRLLDSPRDIPVLAPYAIREIIYRIIQDDRNDTLKQFAVIGSHAQRIAMVIERLNRDFALPLRVDELAEEAGMSESSLYYYFKEVTAMSPIQYQKRLRLQEARRLLLTDTMEAAEAAFQVGYESPSYFNREYARMFGNPPIRDIQRFRDALQTGKVLY
ncbi:MULTISPECIES: AraC family transcriptional regulator [Paenibacillus]|uniref:Transcriptional regulator n=1 Tax=Paenibacillus albilobatus TaxID=2716884 RepID=A0A919XKC8_9BACL|nr:MULTISPECIES: AraC family transcriptional regulator [Paenibacillus]GIO34309.1 transcriptional regulator [Paenibacillus albilobatus]